MNEKSVIEISINIRDYKEYDVYYQDPASKRFLLYKPKGVNIDEIRIEQEKVPKRLYVSLYDQLNFVSSRHKKYNKKLKNILKTKPSESKKLLVEVLDLGVTVPVGKVVRHMKDTVDIVVKEYMADQSIIKKMIEITVKDASTSVHSVNVMLHCLGYARQCNYGYDTLKLFGLMGLFHDIGKLRIPDKILKAPRRLTEDEFDLIKTHPNQGYNILVKSNLDKRVRLAALQHHERSDGSGYPRKIEGKDILPESKALAVIDVYEALTNLRPYKDPVDPLDALKIIKEDVEKGKLDMKTFQEFACSLIGGKV